MKNRASMGTGRGRPSLHISRLRFHPNCQNKNEYISVLSSICLVKRLPWPCRLWFRCAAGWLIFGWRRSCFGLHESGHFFGVHWIDARVGIARHKEDGGYSTLPLRDGRGE